MSCLYIADCAVTVTGTTDDFDPADGASRPLQTCCLAALWDENSKG